MGNVIVCKANAEEHLHQRRLSRANYCIRIVVRNTGCAGLNLIGLTQDRVHF